MDGMDAGRIADDLDKRWCNKFKEILFEDWVRWAQGYPTAFVAKFLDWISASRDLLVKYLQQVPKAFEKYTQVERVNFSPSIPLRNCG